MDEVLAISDSPRCPVTLEGRESRSVAPLLFFPDQLLHGPVDRACIGPVCPVRDPSARIDHPDHIGQTAVGAVGRSLDIVDEHGPGEAPSVDRCSCPIELLFDAAVVGPVVAGMGFTGVDEDALDSERVPARRELVEDRRRQSTIRSSEAAELDHQGADLPQILELHQGSV